MMMILMIYAIKFQKDTKTETSGEKGNHTHKHDEDSLKRTHLQGDYICYTNPNMRDLCSYYTAKPGYKHAVRNAFYLTEGYRTVTPLCADSILTTDRKVSPPDYARCLCSIHLCTAAESFLGGIQVTEHRVHSANRD